MIYFTHTIIYTESKVITISYNATEKYKIAQYYLSTVSQNFWVKLGEPENISTSLRANFSLEVNFPGTGKTSLVKCLASRAKFHFMNLSSSSLVSKWRGDSEKLISIVFEVARHNAPSIVFLDEAESILGNRLVNGEHEASKR